MYFSCCFGRTSPVHVRCTPHDVILPSCFVFFWVQFECRFLELSVSLLTSIDHLVRKTPRFVRICSLSPGMLVEQLSALMCLPPSKPTCCQQRGRKGGQKDNCRGKNCHCLFSFPLCASYSLSRSLSGTYCVLCVSCVHVKRSSSPTPCCMITFLPLGTHNNTCLWAALNVHRDSLNQQYHACIG